MHPSIYLPTYLSTRLGIYLSIYPSIYLSIYLGRWVSPPRAGCTGGQPPYPTPYTITLEPKQGPHSISPNTIHLYVYISIYRCIYLGMCEQAAREVQPHTSIPKPTPNINLLSWEVGPATTSRLHGRSTPIPYTPNLRL